MSFHNTGDVSTEQMRTVRRRQLEPSAVVQATTADGDQGFLVRTTTTASAEEKATQRANQVADKLGLSTGSFG